MIERKSAWDLTKLNITGAAFSAACATPPLVIGGVDLVTDASNHPIRTTCLLGIGIFSVGVASLCIAAAKWRLSSIHVPTIG